MSFAHLATIGTLSYNGYTFDGSSQVSVRIEFVMDDAQRTILYHKHTIRVKTFIQNDASTDASVESIRAALGHQGAPLTFINKGFGDDLIVNVAGGYSLRDVKWGPKPTILTWNPVGSANACEVEWEVEVCVPKCSATSNGRSTGVMAINYEVSISVDNRGLSTRTVSGHLEIAQTRVGHNIPDSADAYRYLIQPPLPGGEHGFGRQSNWQFSADRSRVEFNIDDVQIPSKNPYPQLVTHIDGSHRCTWSRGSQHKTSVRSSISMDIETAMGAPPMLAWNLFGSFVRQRFNILKQGGKQFFLDEVSVEEDLFGLRNRFGCTYRVLMNAATALNQIDQSLFDFASVGMWKPVGTNWGLWKSSLSHVFDNRGLAGLAVPAANDVIIDLCGTGTTIPWNGTIKPPTQAVAVQPGIFKNERPKPDLSYLQYQCGFQITNDRPTMRQAPLQQTESDQGSGNMLDINPINFPPRSSGNASPDVIQTGPGRYSLSFFGEAKRAGYEIPRPKVISVGGQTPVERKADYICKHLGSSFGVPVFHAVWNVAYELPSPPTSVDPPIRIEN